MKRRLFLFVAVLALVGVVLGVRAFSDPKAREIRRIEKRVQALAEAVSFAEGDSPFLRLGYPQRVVAFFGPSIELAINLGTREAHATLQRSELEERAGVMRAASRGLSVQFLDVVPTVNDALNEATVHLTSKIFFLGDLDYTVQEFRLQLSRHPEAGWQVLRVATVRTME